MKIGIIGAGNIGGTLTRRLTALGHDVSVANSRGPQTLADLAAETGATAVEVTEAARGAEVVVVTIPQKHVPDLPAGVLDGAAPGAAVVDTGNYYPQQRDGAIEADRARHAGERLGASSSSAARWSRRSTASTPQHLLEKGQPAGTRGRIALPVAGDDAAAKAKVMALVEELGFDAVDAGSIAESWRQQPGTPVYGADLDAEGVRHALAAALPDRAPEWRAASRD